MNAKNELTNEAAASNPDSAWDLHVASVIEPFDPNDVGQCWGVEHRALGFGAGGIQ
jgi:hypothetical protein